MRNDYPQFVRGEIETLVFDKLSKEEKNFLKEYLTYRQARGINVLDKLNDVRRFILQLRYTLDKPFKEMTLQEFRQLLVVINKSSLGINTKNHLKTDLANLIRYTFDDWFTKFKELEDIKFEKSDNKEYMMKNKLEEKDVELLIKEEKTLFWKTFLLVMSEGGLRTIEARSLKWSNIKLSIDGNISEVFIPSTKTDTARTIFLQEATYYLERLKAEQENLNSKGIYIFCNPKHKDKPLDKSTVSVWFRRLSKKVLGVEKWCYLLRHYKATQLYKMAKENKIAEDTAVRFMGHSKSMIATYDQTNPEEVKNMLKDQIFKHKISDLPKKQKEALEKQIEELKTKLELIENNRVEDNAKMLNSVLQYLGRDDQYTAVLNPKEMKVVLEPTPMIKKLK